MNRIDGSSNINRIDFAGTSGNDKVVKASSKGLNFYGGFGTDLINVDGNNSTGFKADGQDGWDIEMHSGIRALTIHATKPGTTTAVYDTVVGAVPMVQVVHNGTAAHFPVNRIDGSSNINRIDFAGTDGNDEFRSNTSIGANAWGGRGNDTLIGGPGNDFLYGGGDNDHLNGRGGSDHLYGEGESDVLITIDGETTDYASGGAGSDITWVDRNYRRNGHIVEAVDDTLDLATMAETVHYVDSFADGVDRTLDGDRIADPTVAPIDGWPDPTYRRYDNNPLFSASGPQMTDVVQGFIGDCYAMAGLGAIAKDHPQVIRQNVVDFDDGTYGVHLGDGYYRVDNDLPTTQFNTLAYARLGANDSMWVAIVEKAFAHHRTRENSYVSIESGSSDEIHRAFGSASADWQLFNEYNSANAMANDILSRQNARQAVTIGFVGQNRTTSSEQDLIMQHVYIVHSVITDASGAVTGIRLRNPWGIDGGNLFNDDGTYRGDGNDRDGIVTVTPEQIFRHTGSVTWAGAF